MCRFVKLRVDESSRYFYRVACLPSAQAGLSAFFLAGVRDSETELRPAYHQVITDVQEIRRQFTKYWQMERTDYPLRKELSDNIKCATSRRTKTGNWCLG